jgi:hypothetical protein
MKKNADRFVHVVFCDDIRHEVGNKVSFMGCYQREMLVPVTPLILARLCIFVTVSTPVARPFKALTLRVHLGANEVAVIEMPSEDVNQSLAPVQVGDTRIMANLGLTLAPLVLTEPGEIRVLVTTEEGDIQGPQLHIKLMAQAELPPAPVLAPANSNETADSAKKDVKAVVKKRG